MTEKLSVEEARRRAKSAANAIRKKIGMRNHALTAERLAQIYPHLQPIQGLAHYEVPHQFVVAHLVEKLRRKAQLNKREETWVRGVFGRVYYNPPKREYQNIRDAALKLHALGGKGRQLFAAIKQELEELHGERVKFYRAHPDADDDFANPMGQRRTEYDFYNDFRKIAELYEAIKVKVFESETFYK